MRIEYIKEFQVCAKYLNMRQAANELFMAQSNLSIHMKQLEISLGSFLFNYRNKKLSLTEAGSHFKKGSQRILDLYSEMQEKCRQINESVGTNDPMAIIAQQHSYIDLGVEAYYQLIDSLCQKHPTLEVLFAKSSRKLISEKLREGTIDLCIEYRCETVEKSLLDYASRGFICKHLCTEPFVVWCEKSSPLSKKLSLSPADLKDVLIMAPNDASFASKKAITELCSSYGFKAPFIIVPTTNQPEFLNAHSPEAVYLYPQSFTQCPLLMAFNSMVAVPFNSSEVNVSCFALTFPSNNPFSDMLIEFLQQKT